MAMLMSSNTPPVVSAHDAMQAAWEAYAASPRGTGRYRAYVEAREALIAATVAAYRRISPDVPEGIAHASASLAYPLHWIGDYYGADSDPAWCRTKGIPLAQEG